VTDITLTAPRGAATRHAQTATRARLVVVHPESSAGVFPLPGDAEVRLGRATGPAARLAAGTLGLPDATVSRAHALILPSRDPARPGHVVSDAGSRNGTFLNGARVSESACHLRDQDVLRLGDVLAIYEASRGVALAIEGQDPAAVDREAAPGESAAAVLLRWQVQGAAPDPSPCLVTGETGTGKERLAAELHRLSGRPGPLVTLNCAALSPQLVESQLFGHARGAFTGAVGAHQGVFRAAERGTLFLDEIGELPLDLQPKLLRALQEREIHPVGETRGVKVDVRVIAATHRELSAMVEQGLFRRDLFARLALWQVDVPPLRARRADVLAWLCRLEARWRAGRTEAAGAAVSPLSVDVEAAEAMLLAEWPENLRGLDRWVHRLAADGGGAVTLPRLDTLGLARDLSSATPVALAAAAAGDPAPVVGERPAIPDAAALAALLAEHGGSVRAVARRLGRERKQVYRWIERYGLRVAAEEGPDDAE
jgi:transcriptional regulator with GAF, ATPase, and Fis domain